MQKSPFLIITFEYVSIHLIAGYSNTILIRLSIGKLDKKGGLCEFSQVVKKQ